MSLLSVCPERDSLLSAGFCHDKYPYTNTKQQQFLLVTKQTWARDFFLFIVFHWFSLGLRHRSEVGVGSAEGISEQKESTAESADRVLYYLPENQNSITNSIERITNPKNFRKMDLANPYDNRATFNDLSKFTL